MMVKAGQQPTRNVDLRRTRHRRLLRILAPLLAVVILVLASCGNGDDDSDQTVATELVDTFLQSWGENDGEAAASVFTGDGVYIDEIFLGAPRAKDQIAQTVETRGGPIAEIRRAGDLTTTDSNTFTVAVEMDAADGGQWSGELEIELAGDLASRIELLSMEAAES